MFPYKMFKSSTNYGNAVKVLSKPEFLEVVRKQKKIEKKVAEELNSSKSEIDHVYVNALLDVLIYDSLKHASLLQAIIDIKTGKIEKSFLDVQMGPRIEMSQSLKKHIRSEEGMLAAYTKLEDQIDDSGIKGLLRQIAEDEKRHHKAIQEMIRLLEEEEYTKPELYEAVSRSLYVLTQEPMAE